MHSAVYGIKVAVRGLGKFDQFPKLQDTTSIFLGKSGSNEDNDENFPHWLSSNHSALLLVQKHHKLELRLSIESQSRFLPAALYQASTTIPGRHACRFTYDYIEALAV